MDRVRLHVGCLLTEALVHGEVSLQGGFDKGGWC
jgi:hypothetical protein